MSEDLIPETDSGLWNFYGIKSSAQTEFTIFL